MANYVYGSLEITGDKKELLKFKEFAKGEEAFFDSYNTPKKWDISKTDLDMNKFIPYPEKFKKIDEDNYKYSEKVKEVKKKVEAGKKKLTPEEREIANELAICELEGNPMPYQTDGYNSGGYEWCSKNWGTKWNFCDVTLDEKNGNLLYTFSTAWSVPFPVLIKMSKVFPNLTFDYYGDEESEEFEIGLVLKEGKIIKQEEKNWAEIKIDKIESGETDDWDYDMDLYNELVKHKGHKVSYDGTNHFLCETCNNKIIWDTSK